MENLTKKNMLQALAALDAGLQRQVELLVGGGSAMILAHAFPLATNDIDAVAKGMELSEISEIVQKIATDLDIPPDWLNSWFSSFTYTLPQDFSQRLIEVYRGKHLVARALGSTDLLVMKCFAHRKKDVAHAKALIKIGADVDFVKKHIEELFDRKIPKAEEALDFLDEILDQLE